MDLLKLREYFTEYGDVDRMYLKPFAADQEKMKKRHNKYIRYEEGWVEFKSKRRAKKVTLWLNNQPVGGKGNKYADALWNIKYLPRFKWAYLSQRLEYEREVQRYRMNVEISQVRKEA